jgi:4-alpha-glucanotransferase
MGLPMVEILVHKFVALSDRLFGTKFDIDTERGMHEDEDFYVTGAEIRERLARAGFINLRVKWFNTQWRLNRLFTAYKPLSSVGE